MTSSIRRRWQIITRSLAGHWLPPDGGEAIFAIARTTGWLAHAMEEYEEKALRFRPRARYIGNRPGSP